MDTPTRAWSAPRATDLLLGNRLALGGHAQSIVRIACCVLAAWLNPATAQESVGTVDPAPPAASSPALTLVPVTVTRHYENAVGTSDAASQGVVRGDRLTDLPLLRPGEVLETVPGLVVTQHSGDGKANQYFLRGYNLDHGTDFSTFIQGVPVNMPSNAHGQGYADLNSLIPELVESIEYRKGPYFADAGDFSAAGSASIRYVDHLERGVADLTTGRFGYRRALLAASTTLNRGLDALAPQADRPRLLGALEMEEDNGPWSVPQNLRKLNGVLHLGDGTREQGWSIDAGLYTAHWDATDQVPLASLRSGQLARYAAIDPTDAGNTGHVTVSAQWHQHDELGYTRLSAYAEHYRLQLWSDFTYFELRPSTGDQFEQAEHRNLIGGEAVHGWNHTVLGRDAQTELGVQLRSDWIRVGLLNSQARVPFETVSDNAIVESQLGLFVQNTTHWTPWLRSLVGLREDRIQVSMNALALPQNSGAANASKILPKVALIFGPAWLTEFFVNAGYGFHSNDARGILDKLDPSTRLPVTSVPALVASRGAELGLRTEIVPGLQSSLALWWLDSDSEIVYSADSANGSSQPNGASKRYGAEWNNHLIVGRWLLLDADLSWIRAHYAKDNDNGASGNDIPNAVPKVASFGATYKPAGPWSAGVVTRYIGSYPLAQDGHLTAPSATVTNLQVRHTSSPSVTWKLEVLNLFDHPYFDIAYEQDYRVAPTSPTVPSGITVHPGEPRQLRIGLDLTF